MTEDQLDRLADKIANRMLAADVLNVEQAAALLQVHANTVRLQAEAGTLPGYRIGNRWRFRRQALLDTITPITLRQGSREP